MLRTVSNNTALRTAIVVALGCLAPPLSASGEALRAADFAVPGEPSVSVSWPVAWQFSASDSKGWPEGTLQFAHPSASDFVLLLTPLAMAGPPSAASLMPDATAIRERVSASGRDQLASSLERELSVIDLLGDTAYGAYFVLTDAAPKAGEFEVMAQGIVAVAGSRFSFTALLHDRSARELEQALELVRSLRPSQPGALRLAVPGAPWILEVAHPTLRLNLSETKARGRSGYFMTSNDTGFAASFFVEPAVKCATSAACRELIQNAGFAHIGKVEKIARSEIGDVSFVECFLPKLQGMRVKQQHWFAQFVVDGYWVDAHVAKTLYREGDRAEFEAIVKSLRFEPKASAAPEPAAVERATEP
jgi:hypothetical protein